MEDTFQSIFISVFFLIPQTFLSGAGGDGYSLG